MDEDAKKKLLEYGDDLHERNRVKYDFLSIEELFDRPIQDASYNDVRDAVQATLDYGASFGNSLCPRCAEAQDDD